MKTAICILLFLISLHRYGAVSNAPVSTECTCGSATMECDRKTRICVCLSGSSGDKCDKCTRGYSGNVSVCSPCAECFDNWDKILNELQNNTLMSIERANYIKTIATYGTYTKEFDYMQQKLKEIDNLLSRMERIDDISDDLGHRVKKINESQLTTLSDNLSNAFQEYQLDYIMLDQLDKKYNSMKNKTKEFEEKGPFLQEENMKGALHLIELAKQMSNKAAQKVEKTQEMVSYANRQCSDADNLIKIKMNEFEKKQAADEVALEPIKNSINTLKTREIPELNSLVCDKHGDPCDEICGGAGCLKCASSPDCENGAKQQAEVALTLANETEHILKETEAKANEFIGNVSYANSSLSKQVVQKAFNFAQEAFKMSNESLFNITSVKKQINELLNQHITSAEDIKKMANDVLKKNIKLVNRDDITELTEQFNNAVDSLTNKDKIIEEIKDDLETVKKIKEIADAVKFRVEVINSTQAIDKVGEHAVEGMGTKVENVKGLLDGIEKKTVDALTNINNIARDVGELTKKMEDFKWNSTKSEQAEYKKDSNTTYKLHAFENKYTKIKSQVAKTLESMKLKTHSLVNGAEQLTVIIMKLEDDINKLNFIPEQNLKKLEVEIDSLINEITKHRNKIQSKAIYYKGCI